VRSFIDNAKQADPGLWDAAKAQGEAIAAGQALDPEFAAFHAKVLALARNDADWRTILRNAALR
jgi:hypothetical protein